MPAIITGETYVQLPLIPGPTGPSAYQVAVSDGFVGTVSEWLESLKGEPGTGGGGLQQWTLGENHELVQIQGVAREVYSHLEDHGDFIRTGENGEPFDKVYKLQVPPSSLSFVGDTLSWVAPPEPAADPDTGIVPSQTIIDYQVRVLKANGTVLGNYDFAHADCRTTENSLQIAGLVVGEDYKFCVRVTTKEMGTSLPSLPLAMTVLETTSHNLIMATAADMYFPIEDASGTEMVAAKGEVNGVYGGTFALGQPSIDIHGDRAVKFSSSSSATGHGLVTLAEPILLPKDFALILLARTDSRTVDRSFLHMRNTFEAGSQLKIRTATDSVELGKLGLWFRGNGGTGTATTQGTSTEIVPNPAFNTEPILDGSTLTDLRMAFISKTNLSDPSKVDVKFVVLHGPSGTLIERATTANYVNCWFNRIGLATNLAADGTPISTQGNRTDLQRFVLAMGANTLSEAKVLEILNASL